MLILTKSIYNSYKQCLCIELCSQLFIQPPSKQSVKINANINYIYIYDIFQTLLVNKTYIAVKVFSQLISEPITGSIDQGLGVISVY